VNWSRDVRVCEVTGTCVVAPGDDDACWEAAGEEKSASTGYIIGVP